jgi:hypothetical protein
MNEPLILHSRGSAGEGAELLPLVLAGRPPEIEGRKCHYRRKEIIADGEWVHRGERKPFTINPPRTKEWEKNFVRRLSAGIRTPILKRHTENPTAEDTLGYILGIEREGEKTYAEMQFIGDDALSLAARNDVSIYEKAEGIDAKGNPYGTFLDHVALTPNPNQPHLGPFLTIAASAGSSAVEAPVYELSTSGLAPERSPTMKPETITKLRAKLNLPDAAAVPDAEVAERAAVLALADPPADKSAEVTALSADVTRLTSELATAKSEAQTATLALSAAQPKQYDELSLSLIGESFATKREQAIASGGISEAGMKMLDAILLPGGKPSGVALALSGDGTSARPLYARICEIIAGNPGVKIGHGVTRAVPSLKLSGDQPEEMDEARRAYVAQSMGIPVPKPTEVARSA